MRVDIEAFKARSKPVTLDGLDLDAFRRRPLDPATLRCLQYMHDVEYHIDHRVDASPGWRAWASPTGRLTA